MSLDKILDDMASYTKLKLAELQTSRMVGGRISLGETDRRSMKLPAAFFACTGTRDGKFMGNLFRTRGLFVLILVVPSKPEGQPTPQDRAHAIARLVHRTLMVVAGAKTWGNAEVQGIPEKVSSANAYTTETDEKGVALWAITWEQMLALTADPVPPPLDSFKKLDADHQIVPSNPEIDAEDTLILEGG